MYYDCAIKLCLMRQTSRSLTSNGCPSEIIDALGQCKAAGLCRPLRHILYSYTKRHNH